MPDVWLGRRLHAAQVRQIDPHVISPTTSRRVQRVGPLRVFDDVPRTNARPATHSESRFGFLNRSASVYFDHVRCLIEEWFSYYPISEQPALRGALRSDNEPCAAAFWELYLHEAYRRAAYSIEVHPAVPASAKRPDFRLTRGDDVFYLEATSVGRDVSEISEERRLEEVHRVLADLKIQDFSLVLSTYSVGDRPLATRQLRTALTAWVAALDPGIVSAAADTSIGYDSLPEFPWDDDGWNLVFHAIPLRPEARGKPRSAVGVMGPGEATMVDNVTGVRRVLAAKVNRYGALDAPLVIAVQSNTEHPTEDYEVDRALFGASTRRPTPSAENRDQLLEEGFWIDSKGWRNAHVPQVISIAGLAPWTVKNTVPRLWSTLEVVAGTPGQPGWLAPMNVLGAEALVGPSTPPNEHFGLAPDWPGLEAPDFDTT
jgi:hypothetical protein